MVIVVYLLVRFIKKGEGFEYWRYKIKANRVLGFGLKY
jgi:hypothetical protein